MTLATDQTTTDFAPPACACPTCGTESKRHSVYTRRIKDIGLDGPVVLDVRVGNYRCPVCRKFFKPDLPFAPKGKRYTARAVQKATASIQQDKATYCSLPNRLERDFSIRPSTSSGWRWFQQFAGNIDIEEYLHWACGRFSGQLSVDSIHDGDMQMWFATDPLNRDLILGFHRAQHANAESLTVFLTRLRDGYGIQPKLFTCDDATVFEKTPGQIWPGVPVQLCHFHVIKCLNYSHLRKSLAARLNAWKPEKPKFPGYHSTEYMRKKREYESEQEQWIEAFRKRRLFMKSLRKLQTAESIEHKEAEFIAECCRRHPSLMVFREFILDFYAIMASKEAGAAELLRRAFLTKWAEEARRDEHLGHVVKLFADDRWFAKLFPFTAFTNASRTTNSTERANRWFRKRQKTHYRCRTEPTIRNMIHADLVYRRNRTPRNTPPVQLKEKPERIERTA